MNRIVANIMPHWLFKKLDKSARLPDIKPSEHPTVFTEDGKSVKWMFLKDTSCISTPHSFSESGVPHRIIWDRNDYCLPDHMYTYYEIYKTTGQPTRRYAMFIEGREIMPAFYSELEQKLDFLKDFDGVFTNQETLLDSLPNAHFVTGWYPWYGSEKGGGERDNALAYLGKTKLISVVSSAKEMCDLHRLRKSVAQKCERECIADAYGDFNGGPIVKCAEYLSDYMYHIAIENQISRGYITEKITNCFLSMTVPIYIGAPDVGDYFNPDGIIYISEPTEEKLMEALKQCSPEDYAARKEAVIDNYNRAKKLLCIEDYMVENYPELF